jgi:hypothetical protein
MPLVLISLGILGIISSNNASAVENFSIEAKIDLTKIPDLEKLKVIAFANGESATKVIENTQNIKLKSISVPFTFEDTNDIVTVGVNDEYFVCAYNLNAETNEMKSYSCIEGNIKEPNGKNMASIGSGPARTLSTGSFQTVGKVGNPDTQNVEINILVPLSDRKSVQNIKVAAMDKGEFKFKEINAAELLKNSKGDTVKFSFNFDRDTEIGQIQEGDLYFACVSANELNPPEGTECEHKVTKMIGRVNNLHAR